MVTNADDSHPSLYGDQTLTSLAAAITQAVTPPPQLPDPDVTWQMYVDQHRNRWGNRQVLVRIHLS